MQSISFHRIIFLLFFWWVLVIGIPAQTGPSSQAENGLVKWYSFKEAQELNEKQPRPFLIDIYTDWCGWCKHMMKTTYSDPGLASYINAYFYPVKFNAETKDTIEYNHKRYFNESTLPKNPHQLAKKFLGNSLSYPSTLFVGNNFQFNLLSQGYLDVRKIEPLLIYTVENIFRTTAYEDFSTKFSQTFYDSLRTNNRDAVQWHTFSELPSLMKKTPRKVLISIGTSWCSGCRIMNAATFSDTLIASYINSNFYLIDFNAESKDTLNFSGKSFLPSGNPQFPFHSLVTFLTSNRLVLPSLVFADEKLQLIESIPYYQHPKGLNLILQFFGDDYYQQLKWEEFVKKRTEGSLTPVKNKK
jgi:thioredoxin-related protein